MNIVYISLYCYKSFPVRIFHSISRMEGVNSHAIFLKDRSTNDYRPITEKETKILLNLVEKTNPKLIGISILAPCVAAAKELVHEIRKVSKARIIVGGVYPTISPDKALEFADFACKGEGELVLMEILERLKQGRDLKNIQGLLYKDGNGKVVNQGQRMLIQNLDEIPFPCIEEPQMYFIDNDCLLEHDPLVKERLAWVMSGRGCVYQCSYCVNSLLIPMNKGNGRFVRQRTPENIIAEIELRAKKYRSLEKILFLDEIFGTSINWTREFCEKYKKRVGLPFICALIPGLIKEDNIKLLADAGLDILSFGIQTGSDKIRNDVLNRPGTNKDILQRANVLTKCGVSPSYDMILNNPFDTIEALEEAIDLLLQLPRPKGFGVTKMHFFPHFPLTLRALKEGFITEKDLTDEKVADAVFKNWVFVPKVFSFNRRDYLESCIGLLAWNSMFGVILSTYLRKRENRFLGLMANVLARIQYWLIFKSPLCLRRLLDGFELLLAGDIRLLVSKTKHVFYLFVKENLKRPGPISHGKLG